MPGEVHSFLFATTFFTFSKVMLNSVTWLTLSFNCLLISFIHWRSFFSLPNTSLKLDKLFHLWHPFFIYLLSFQRSEESLLVPLKDCLASFSVFLHILRTLSFCTSAFLTTAPLHFSGCNCSQSRLSIP